MSFTAKDVMELRAQTGAALMAAKKALVETAGDMDAAIDLLRKSGEAKAAKKADRATSEGAIKMIVADDNSKAAIASILCETDFVARNDDFQALLTDLAQTALEKGAEAAKAELEPKITAAIVTIGENMQIGDVIVLEGEYVNGYIHGNAKSAALVSLSASNEEVARNVAMHVVAMSPKYLDASEVSAADVAKEKEIWKAQLLEEGKPENIIDNIMAGKEKKYAAESALNEQPFVMDPSTAVKDYANNTVAAFTMLTV
ncbi:MAG: translation elongation factor Ts [Patescibacteria group bacterium]|nr:translation elongation factor Ts [Patescibacteria group bacterium]